MCMRSVQTRHRNVTGAPEPLFYYSAFADETIPWLATGAEYNDDFTELVVHIREGVEWSDGEPFTANDVAFTLNMLIDNAPLLTNSAEVKDWVKEATAVDDLTVKIVFNLPRPRFLFSHLNAKYDTGILWVPEHIYKDVEEPNSFAFYDLEKGWPVVTGPFNVVAWTSEQQIIDRRDDLVGRQDRVLRVTGDRAHHFAAANRRRADGAVVDQQRHR